MMDHGHTVLDRRNACHDGGRFVARPALPEKCRSRADNDKNFAGAKNTPRTVQAFCVVEKGCRLPGKQRRTLPSSYTACRAKAAVSGKFGYLASVSKHRVAHGAQGCRHRLQEVAVRCCMLAGSSAPSMYHAPRRRRPLSRIKHWSVGCNPSRSAVKSAPMSSPSTFGEISSALLTALAVGRWDALGALGLEVSVRRRTP